MGIGAPIDITDCRRFFAEPATARQRQYEALRAFFLDGLTSKEVAHRFGYSHGAFRVLCHDISRALKEQGIILSATAVREILAAEGFAPLPRRLDEERPVLIGPTAEAVADVRAFALSPREFTTRVGGLFLFVPDLIRLDCEALARNAKLPGSRMIPAEHALRASLALKLWSIVSGVFAAHCNARLTRQYATS